MNKRQLEAAVTLPASICALLCRNLPRASSFEAALRVIESARQQWLGDGLLTVNAVEPVAGADETIELQRIWSSRSDEYPVAGRKTKALTDWTRQLLVRGQVFVGEGSKAVHEACRESLDQDKVRSFLTV